MRRAARVLAAACVVAMLSVGSGVGGSAAYGQAASDTSRVVLRTPKPDVLQRYQDDEAYDYTEAASDEGSGLLDLFFRSLGDFLTWVFRTEGAGKLAEITFYGLIAFIVGYGLLRIIRMERYSATRRNRTGGEGLEGIEERVDSTDFDPLIDDAEERGAFREAIRLRYLKVLQHLDRTGAIEWAPQKTNRTYRLEVRDTPLLGDFDEATDVFEIVWYGDVQIDARDYDRLRPPFDRLLHASPGPDAVVNEADGPSESRSSGASPGGEEA